MASPCSRRSSRQHPNSSRRRHYLGLAPLRPTLMPSKHLPSKPSPLAGTNTADNTLPSPRRERSLNEYLVPPPSPTKSQSKAHHSTLRTRSAVPKALNLVSKEAQVSREGSASPRSLASRTSLHPGSPQTPVYDYTVIKPVRNPVAAHFIPASTSRLSSPPVTARSSSVSRRSEIGPFQFIRQLQRGTYGAPFSAHDRSTNRIICVRVSGKARMDTDDMYFRRILTEFLCFKHISEQPAAQRAFLMELHGVLQDEDTVLFAMPLMQFDMLGLIRGRGKRPHVRRWVAQIALGIDALHTMGIIHRDIKPENMLYDASTDTIRITDFNVAYINIGNAPLERGCVYAKEYNGSRPYLAPEILSGRWYGVSVDWWALGCIMFDLIAGELLFRDDEQVEKYTTWDCKKEGMTFLGWTTELSDKEEAVLAGLLNVRPQHRFNLKDLRHQPYFVDEKRTNVFEILVAESLGRRSPKPAALDFQLDDPATQPVTENRPLCYATPTPRARNPENMEDFYAFAWVNKNGIWGRG